MDTRVLTLFDFDDEEFLPKEEPKKKTAADKAGATPAESNAATATQPLPEPVTQDPISSDNHKEAFAGPGGEYTAAAGADAGAPAAIPEMKPAETLPAPGTETSVPDAGAAAVAPEDAPAEISGPPHAPDITGIHEQPVAGPAAPTAAAEATTGTGEPPLHEDISGPDPGITEAETQAEADEALNRQIISELIQLDYTALIHRDYPFDVSQTQVIHKETPIAAAPVQEQAAALTEPDATDSPEEPVTPLPEWTLEKNYYTIGEVAQLFQVNTSHIRFWTNEFKLKPRTTRKGDRLYSPADIAELRLIHHLVKEKKHTIKGAREKLKAEKAGVGHKLDLKESLSGLKDMLIRIREQL